MEFCHIPILIVEEDKKTVVQQTWARNQPVRELARIVGQVSFKQSSASEFTAIKSQEKSVIRVWDLLVRLCHWSLAIFFLLAYVLAGDRLNLHVHVGYTIALLVLFRVLWGVIGSDTARFVNFVVWPWQSFQYIRHLTQGKASYYLGHNPAGAAMIVALLVSLLLTALSGIALYALEGGGPLANTFVKSWPGGLLVDVHEVSADLSLALVVLHVFGVIFSSYIYRENLTKSMITGYKNEPGLEKQKAHLTKTNREIV